MLREVARAQFLLFRRIDKAWVENTWQETTQETGLFLHTEGLQVHLDLAVTLVVPLEAVVDNNG
jgi:hypothetical protein